AKIADVHVPARPRSDAGHGQGRQIACHDRRRPAQEGKWAGEHAAITNRYELLHARGVLPFENFNGIGTIGSAVIMRMRFTRYPFAQCPAGSHSFSDGGTLEHEAVESRTVLFRPEHPVKGRVDSGLQLNRAHCTLHWFAAILVSVSFILSPRQQAHAAPAVR